VWSAAWDQTRDAEMPGRTFVDLVLGNIASVEDPSVSQTLLRQLAGTLEYYVAPEHRQATVTAAADRLRGLLEAAAPGSDQQLLFARSFAQHATTPAQLDVLAGLLSGTRRIDGLAVDTDLRWSLLVALVAGGVAGEPEIAAELTRDDTATGRLHAAAARAAVTTPESKAAAWKAVVDDGGLPNAVQASMIGGFGRVHDRELLAPFVTPYFESLTRVWAERTNEMASQIAVGLYPSTQPPDLVLERTDEWLSSADAEPALRRLVIEGRDASARAAKAQECDRTQP